MNDFDLKLANIFKSINQQNEKLANESIQEEKVENTTDTSEKNSYKGFIPQIKRKSVRFNMQNYAFEVHSFFEEKIKLSLHKNNFKALSDDINTDEQVVLYNNQGAFFHINLFKKPLLYKSLTFFKLKLLQHYEKINVPISWLKLNKTENLRYGIYKIALRDKSYCMIHFSGKITDKESFGGSFIFPDGFREQWQDVYEASLHLLEINKNEELVR